MSHSKSLKTIKDLRLKDKSVLIRADLNVTLGKGLAIVDDTRIRQTLPTIEHVLNEGGSVILASHLGDPEGKPNPDLSLAPIADYLTNILGQSVPLISWQDRSTLKTLEPGKVVLLENLRFQKGETTNAPDFSRELALLGDIYVNDAFGVSHRTHASVLGVAEHTPVFAGLLLSREIQVLSQILQTPGRPLMFIVGGAKVSTKIGLLSRLASLADIIAIGGGMANTFLAAKGYNLGKSFFEPKFAGEAKHLLSQANNHKVKILLPVDLIVSDPDKPTHLSVVRADKVPATASAMDIGPETEAVFGSSIAHSQTIVWNGPMGVVEQPEFARGTDFIYYSLTENEAALTVVGGGDTLSAITKEEHLERIDHLSTGGGAMLSFLETGTLPALEVIEKK